jgi:hypothetical protein
MIQRTRCFAQKESIKAEQQKKGQIGRTENGGTRENVKMTRSLFHHNTHLSSAHSANERCPSAFKQTKGKLKSILPFSFLILKGENRLAEKSSREAQKRDILHFLFWGKVVDDVKQFPKKAIKEKKKRSRSELV